MFPWLAMQEPFAKHHVHFINVFALYSNNVEVPLN